MTQNEERRERAEEAFQRYLDGTQSGKVSDRDEFIAGTADDIRSEVERMIGDYEKLVERMGGNSLSLQPGEKIGEYELIKKLGGGGFGEVWEAQQATLGRKVALKLAKPSVQWSISNFRRFLQEAETGKRLDHSGIIQVYDSGELNGIPYIAQELVPEGRSLDDYLSDLRKRRTLPREYYRSIAAMFKEIAEAIQCAHESGVIHRDLKPSNILLNARGQPKIADFGLALVEGELVLSRTGDFLGTPFYMSPEQAMAKRIKIDLRTDIFSLGATLYEALTFVRAFDGDTKEQVLSKITLDDPPDPRRVRSQVPREIGLICMKALQKRPLSRYQTMAELAADLKAFRRRLPIRAKSPSAWTHVAKWSRRHPILASVGSLTLAALLIISHLLILSENALGDAKWATYTANISGADSARESGNVPECARRLERCPTEFRHWEWEHLKLQTRAELAIWDGLGQRINALAYNSNRDVVIAGAMDGRIWLLDPRQGGQRRVLRGHDDAVTCFAMFDGGRYLLSGSRDKTIRLWDLSDRQMLSISAFVGHSDWVTSIDVSYDGKRLVSGSRDNTVRVWDVQSATNQRVLEGHEGWISKVAVLGYKDRVLSASWDGTLRIWSDEPQDVSLQLEGHTGRVTDFVLGNQIVSGSEDGTLRVWDSSTGEPLAILEGHQGGVTTLAIDNEIVASGSDDRTIRIWDIEKGESLATLEGHSGAVTSLAFDRWGQHLISGAWDRTVRVWDASAGQELDILRRNGGWITSLAMHREGVQFVSSSSEGTVRLWGLALNHGAWSFILGSRLGLSSTAFHPDMKVVVTASNNQQLACSSIDEPNIDVIRQFGWRGPRDSNAVPWKYGQANCLAFHPEGNLFASASKSGIALVKSSDSTRTREWLKGHDGDVTSLAFSPDGRFLASGGEDKSVRIWELGANRELKALFGHRGSIRSLVFLPSTGQIASGSEDASIRIWDIDSGKQVALLREHTDAVTALALTPSGRSLVSASMDSSIRIWDLSKWRTARILEGHHGGVTSLAFSPDDERVISGSLDKTIRIWDRKTGACLLVLDQHRKAIISVAFDSLLGRILSVSTDGMVRVWESQSDMERHRRRMSQAKSTWQGMPDSFGSLFYRWLPYGFPKSRFRSWSATKEERFWHLAFSNDEGWLESAWPDPF